MPGISSCLSLSLLLSFASSGACSLAPSILPSLSLSLIGLTHHEIRDTAPVDVSDGDAGFVVPKNNAV